MVFSWLSNVFVQSVGLKQWEFLDCTSCQRFEYRALESRTTLSSIQGRKKSQKSVCNRVEKRKPEYHKKLTFLTVNVFNTKVLIWNIVFTSPTGDGTAISTWLSEPREGPAVCSTKAVPSFLSYFKTLSIRPAPGIEPATSRSAVKRSTY